MKRPTNTPAKTPATLERSRMGSRQTLNTQQGGTPEASKGAKRRESLSIAATTGPISLVFVALAIWLLNNMESGSILLVVVAVVCIAWGAGGLIFTVNQLLAAYDAKD